MLVITKHITMVTYHITVCSFTINMQLTMIEVSSMLFVKNILSIIIQRKTQKDVQMHMNIDEIREVQQKKEQTICELKNILTPSGVYNLNK